MKSMFRVSTAENSLRCFYKAAAGPAAYKGYILHYQLTMGVEVPITKTLRYQPRRRSLTGRPHGSSHHFSRRERNIFPYANQRGTGLSREAPVATYGARHKQPLYQKAVLLITTARNPTSSRIVDRYRGQL